MRPARCCRCWRSWRDNPRPRRRDVDSPAPPATRRRQGARRSPRAVSLLFAGAPPAGWTEPGFDDRALGGARRRGRSRRGSRRCPGTRSRPPGSRSSTRSRRSRSCFARASPSPSGRARVLELRVAYNDAFVAYVNGREVARRGIARQAGGDARRTAPRSSACTSPSLAATAVALTPDGNLLAVAVYPYPGRTLVIPTAPAAMIGLARRQRRSVRARARTSPRPPKAREDAAGTSIWETDLPATGKVVARAGATRDGGDGGQAAPVAAPRRRRARSRRPRARHDRSSALNALAAGRATATASRSRRPPATGRERAGALRDAARAARAAALRRLRRHALPGPRRPPRRGRGAGARGAGAGDQHRRSHRRGQRGIELAAVLRRSPRRWARSRRSFPRWATTTARAAARARSRPGRCSACRQAGAARSRRRSTWAACTSSSLDTNDGGGAQRDWLRDDLARARRHHARAVFAFCHEPPWSHGLHGDSHRMVRDYAPLLVAGHVDVLFCGHDHIYERGAGATPEGQAHLHRHRRGRRAALQPALPGGLGPAAGRRSRAAAALSAERGGADQDLPLRHGHRRRRRHPALPEATRTALRSSRVSRFHPIDGKRGSGY